MRVKPLKSLSIAELKDSLIEVILTHSQHLTNADHHSIVWENVRRGDKLVEELKKRDNGLSLVLNELLDDDRPEVRSYAAVYSKDVLPQKTEQVLEGLVMLEGPLSEGATYRLRELRENRTQTE